MPQEERQMRRLAILGAIGALLALTLPAPALASQGRFGTCSDGTMAAGTYTDFIVRGVCRIATGATVQINGNLVIADGASLDDHGVEGWGPVKAQIHVSRNVLVGRGAVLGLGWNSAAGPDGGALGLDTVGGSIIASQPLALQIGGVTIGRNLISIGGGVLSSSAADFRNFPIKDNVIGGDLVVSGWQGGWMGVIRNTIGGNAIIAFNRSSSSEAGPGTDSDSTEIMSSFGSPQTIGRNLICIGNLPAAQVNPSDGGAPNVVQGRAIGQCAGLTQ